MRGRRVPELCCGAAETFLREVAATQHVEFLGRCGGLPENEAAKVMHELSIGKDFVLAELRMRTDCFSQLPLHLLCLGHHDLGVVRAHLAICLIQYEHLRCTGAEAHPMTRALLSPGGPLRDSVMVFFHGGTCRQLCLTFVARRKCHRTSRWRSSGAMPNFISICAQRRTTRRPLPALGFAGTRFSKTCVTILQWRIAWLS